jgi:glycosyltransferase involved in cell wall biosynthesis
MDRGLSPTFWQKALYPIWAQQRIDVLLDGIDTDTVRPDCLAALTLAGTNVKISAGQEVVTFVSRNLEPYRGVHIFMRCLPEILSKRPNAKIIIVGGEDKGYGPLPANGRSWLRMMMDEVGGQLDLSRVIFVGQVEYGAYLSILQTSAVHVYLTYPFILSWSIMEAMSAGCLVVASGTAPVREVIEHGVNGLLVDFFDTSALAAAVTNALAEPSAYAHLRSNARKTIVERYGLHSVCLPRQIELIERIL